MKTLQKISTTKGIGKLERQGAEIEFEALGEESSPFDQFDDNESAQRIVDRLNAGNEAAWFCAKVTVTYRGKSADDYLGGCSYDSFKQFKSELKGYYCDMINQCVDEINTAIDGQNAHTQKQWDIRRAKNMISKYGLHIIESNTIPTL